MGTAQVTAPTGEVRLQRAPLVPAAVALILGVVAGRYAPLGTAFYVVVALVFLAAAVLTFRRPHLHIVTSAAVGLVIFASGAVHVRLSLYHLSENHVVTYTAQAPILATVRGQVVSTPMIVQPDPNLTAGYRRPARTCFFLRTEALKSDHDWLEVTGLVRVIVREPDDRLSAGQNLELVGWLGRIRPPMNPGQFDAAAAARNQHTLAYVSVESADGVTVLSDEVDSWAGRLLWRLRSLARQHWVGLGPEQDEQLLTALLIGDRHPALETLNRTMMQAGVVHFMSISGAHLAVFMGFVYLLCRLAALSPRRSAGAALAVLAVYMLLAEPNGPLLRSAIMAASLCLATILGRRASALNALALATVVLLVIDPMELFSAGFQLSFGMVAGLILLHHPVKSFLFGRWIRRRGLTVYRDSSRVRRWLSHVAADWLMSGLAISLIAYVVSVPLVAYHFGLFSPYAAVLSFLVTPLVTIILIPGYISLALAGPMPNLSYLFGRGAAGASEWLASAVGAMRWLPGLSFEVRPVGVWWVLLFYAAMALVLLRRRVPWGRVLATLAVIGLVGATAYTQRTAPAPPAAELNVLAVGAGQCVVLRTPSGATFVIDAGSRSDVEVYSQTLGPFLRSRRLPDPSAAFVSHPNTDHFGAMTGLIADRRTDQVFLSDYFIERPGSAEESAATDLLVSCRRHKVPIVRTRAGEVLQLDDRTRLEVLWPPGGRKDLADPDHANDSSLVLRITCDGRSVLLPGDATRLAQGELLGQGVDLRADVLVMPHHGGWNPNLPAFFQAVSPKVAIVSNNIDSHAPAATGPKAQFYQRLRTACRLHSTPRDGWICVRFGEGRIDVQTMR